MQSARRPAERGARRLRVLEARITIATSSLLNSVQDFISEELTWPWPSTEGRSKTHMALPYAVIENGKLVFGYGEPGRFSLELEPINIVELDPRRN